MSSPVSLAESLQPRRVEWDASAGVAIATPPDTGIDRHGRDRRDQFEREAFSPDCSISAFKSGLNGYCQHKTRT
jgi:hypothetical protein